MGRPSYRISPSVRNLILILSLTVLRCLVILSFGDDLQQRVELSNVFTGFKGIKEASALLHHGVFPYSGGLISSCMCHGTSNSHQIVFNAILTSCRLWGAGPAIGYIGTADLRRKLVGTMALYIRRYVECLPHISRSEAFDLCAIR